MAPDPTRAYFWPALNKRPTSLWPENFLTSSEGKNMKNLVFLGENFQTQTKDGWHEQQKIDSTQPRSKIYDPDPSLLQYGNLSQYWLFYWSLMRFSSYTHFLTFINWKSSGQPIFTHLISFRIISFQFKLSSSSSSTLTNSVNPFLKEIFNFIGYNYR